MQSVYEGILSQLIHGDSRRDRPVLRSEAGRIKNELKTMVSEALEIHGDRIRLHPSRIPDDVIPSDDRAILIDALRRFREEHPACFGWLEIAD